MAVPVGRVSPDQVTRAAGGAATVAPMDWRRPDGPDEPRELPRRPVSDGIGDDGRDEQVPWALRMYHGSRANLDDLDETAAEHYIATNRDTRPWLASAEGCDPGVQRVFATVDRGIGHHVERHEGYGGDEAQETRVVTDPRCGVESTRIHDPTAFAVAFAKGVQHRAVVEALDSVYDATPPPQRVDIPIPELLGHDGHMFCSGYRLTGDDPDRAWNDRKAWLAAQTSGKESEGLPAPQAERIESFEGGVIRFAFGRNHATRQIEVLTMFPHPAREDPAGG